MFKWYLKSDVLSRTISYSIGNLAVPRALGDFYYKNNMEGPPYDRIVCGKKLIPNVLFEMNLKIWPMVGDET